MSQPASEPINMAPVYYPPAYGQIQWQTQQAPPPDNSAPPQPVPQDNSASSQAPAPEGVTPTPAPSAKAVHHHPYTPGYIRKKLQKIGVKTAPSYIVNRKEIIATDRKHSTIHFPQKGLDGKKISAQIFSPRNFTDAMVRTRMQKVSDPVVLKKIVPLMRVENKANRYYWHKGDGYTYCHTVDSWGYHWYGWYEGDRYFWTRYFSGLWWFYHSDYGRWCFWHDGFWWWQDPYHVGDLYCYTNDDYIPCNSANDTIRVTTEDQLGAVQYKSPDGSRMVKVSGASQDAFLYDTSSSPAFGATYLASGVKGVEFSNLQNGGSLQVILKITDGSFDMFDGDGNPYNPGAMDTDQPQDPTVSAVSGKTKP